MERALVAKKKKAMRPRPAGKTAVLGLRITPELKAAIEQHAEYEDLTTTGLIERAVENYILISPDTRRRLEERARLEGRTWAGLVEMVTEMFLAAREAEDAAIGRDERRKR